MTLLLLATLAAAPDANLLSLEAGAALLEAPPSWGGRWSPEALVDGDPATGWCNAADTKGPFSFLFELEQRSVLSAVEATDTNAEESTNPGISASGLEVWVSSTNAREGFRRVATLPLKRSGSARAALPKETFARWVRLVVPGNFGHARYTELMEVSLLGQALEPAPTVNLAGAWRLDGGGVLKLAGDGGALTGCIAWQDDAWAVKGTARGRTARLTWSDAGLAQAGTATVVLTDSGVRGRWLGGGSESGPLNGATRVEAEVDCRTVVEDVRFGKRLRAEKGSLTLTGVSFDPTSDELRAEPRSELGALERLLATGRLPRVRLLVLGRSTEPAPDELKKCERRAQRLLQRLQAAGVPTSALDVGIGILKVGSAVQLEPRVEVSLPP